MMRRRRTGKKLFYYIFPLLSTPAKQKRPGLLLQDPPPHTHTYTRTHKLKEMSGGGSLTSRTPPHTQTHTYSHTERNVTEEKENKKKIFYYISPFLTTPEQQKGLGKGLGQKKGEILFFRVMDPFCPITL
jgi:hypothetical protein